MGGKNSNVAENPIWWKLSCHMIELNLTKRISGKWNCVKLLCKAILERYVQICTVGGARVLEWHTPTLVCR